MELKEVNLIQLWPKPRDPKREYLMSQLELSKGGCRDERKEKRAFAVLAVGILLYFP
jgi:hypothetical protein